MLFVADFSLEDASRARKCNPRSKASNDDDQDFGIEKAVVAVA